MLKHLTLKDFVIVTALDVALGPGFSVLTGETGAGKSILIDALQLALGARADAGVVREGAARADITAVFDTPASLLPWLEQAGLEPEDDSLLLRRVVDAQGKSRAFINGSPATLTQLREVAEHLVDIHGQHAWQGLTRPASARALLDAQAGADTRPVAQAFAQWKQAEQALEQARSRQNELADERDRLRWQLEEFKRLSPGDDEWAELNAEHQRLSHGQSLIDAAAQATQWLADDDTNASSLLARAVSGLEAVADYDPRLLPVLDTLRAAQAQLDDAASDLNTYLGRVEPDPGRLAELDARLSEWLGLARRWRRPPESLPALGREWQHSLGRLDEAADLALLEQRCQQAQAHYREAAQRLGRLRRRAAGPLAQRVSQAMQSLGMAGGRFEVALLPEDTPRAHGLETVEFQVAGHAGSAPRALAKVASGGELSRLALAIAVTTAQDRDARRQADSPHPGTLIFDEIDSGVGGTVADAVGRLMRELGRSTQVMAVTHLPQVAACADRHFVVAKATQAGRTHSQIQPVAGDVRVAEVARMLGGEPESATSQAHARELIQRGSNPVSSTGSHHAPAC